MGFTWRSNNKPQTNHVTIETSLATLALECLIFFLSLFSSLFSPPLFFFLYRSRPLRISRVPYPTIKMLLVHFSASVGHRKCLGSRLGSEMEGGRVPSFGENVLCYIIGNPGICTNFAPSILNFSWSLLNSLIWSLCLSYNIQINQGNLMLRALNMSSEMQKNHRLYMC